MDVLKVIKAVKAGISKAVGVFKNFASDDNRHTGRVLGIVGIIFFVLSLPAIAITGLFGWMGQVNSDTIQIDGDYYASLLHGTVIEILYDPNYPDNIPWPEDSLQLIGNFYRLTWNEIEMCNVIYHVHLKNEEDGITDVLRKYSGLVDCFASADLISPYYINLYTAFGVQLTSDEVQVLNEVLAYTPPWERSEASAPAITNERTDDETNEVSEPNRSIINSGSAADSVPAAEPDRLQPVKGD